MRNVYVASAPDFKAVRITKFMDDDGVDVGSVRLSDDGTMAIFVRGSGQNRVGWVANPSHDPDGGERAVWAAKTDGTGAWRLAVDHEHRSRAAAARRRLAGALARRQVRRLRARRPDLSRAHGARRHVGDGHRPACRSSRSGGARATRSGRPTARKLAFVSTRENHAFIGVYDMKTRKVDFIAPSTDIDGSPTWSPDGKRIAFIRRPGTPFGQQVAATGRSVRHRPRPAAAAAVGRGGRGGGGGARRCRRRRSGGCRPAVAAAAVAAVRGGRRRDAARADTGRVDGLCRAAFAGGYTLSFMVADVATGKAQEFWHNQPNDRDVRRHQQHRVGRRSRRVHRAASRTTSGIATSR